jgi:hypothetical protein
MLCRLFPSVIDPGGGFSDNDAAMAPDITDIPMATTAIHMANGLVDTDIICTRTP